MENVISIVNTRKNPIEFDISIQGVETKDTFVKFVIETDSVHFCFPCEYEGDGKWVAIIPPLPHIERVAYPFHIEVIVDGYYFEPYRGTLNVTTEPEVKTSDVQTTRSVVAPVVKSVTIGEDEKEIISDDEFQTLAEKIISKHRKKEKTSKKKESKKEELVKEEKKEKPKKKIDKTKDDAIKEAIKRFKDNPLKVDEGEVVSFPKKIKIPRDKAHKVMTDDEYKKLVKTLGPHEVDTTSEPGLVYIKYKFINERNNEEEPKKAHKSNLADVVKNLEKSPALSEQAKKVRDIVNTTKH